MNSWVFVTTILITLLQTFWAILHIFIQLDVLGKSEVLRITNLFPDPGSPTIRKCCSRWGNIQTRKESKAFKMFVVITRFTPSIESPVFEL